MKKLFATIVLLGFVACLDARAEGPWQYVKSFTPKKVTNGGHGVAVDPDGKVWIAPYQRTDSVGTVFTNALYCFYPNGTQASFSPIKIMVGSSFRDTLGGAVYCRGITTDQRGNIIASYFDKIYRVDYRTGAALNRATVVSTFASTLAGVDSLGEIFVGTVLTGNPIKIFGDDFSFLINAVDTVRVITRSLTASPWSDGKDIYHGDMDLSRVNVYHSDNGSIGPYVLRDSLLVGGKPESFGWHPRTKYMWVSAGNPSLDVPRVGSGWSVWTWYAFDVATKQVRDSVKLDTNYYAPAARFNARPRGIAFSPKRTGALYDTVYLAAFGPDSAYVQMFRRQIITSVEQIDNRLPESYTLSQNYPNPFNPTTEIEFKVPQSGVTTLKVYDMLGREVATLVNEQLGVGTFKSKFDASNLSSGTYIYRLTSGTASISKKMMLVK